MDRNANRTLRICLAAVTMLLLFAEVSLAAQTHTVRKGDTLHQISKQFGTTVSAIQKANGLKSTTIRTGQVLLISSQSVPRQSTSTPGRIVTYGRALQDGLKVLSDGKVIAELPKNSGFTVLGRDDGKFNIKLADGRTGWVDDDSVRLEESDQSLPAASSYAYRQDIVRTALSYRGARYRRGGESASGFDCSGFVKYVYANEGVKLPHDSRAMYNHGKPVQKADLIPGDLVFFANTYRKGISHVGLYIGEGKFVHASTARTGVRVDELESDYYRRHYYGAKRLE